MIDHFNPGAFMKKNIKSIYDNSTTQIIYNNKNTDRIYIKTGIKQGCALSMILYILCIEELIIPIKNNKNIKGFSKCGVKIKIPDMQMIW